MRATFAWSPSETTMLLPSLRFTLGDLDERMCRVFVWCRTILPVPVFLKRLAAPLWVFNLGIFFSFFLCLGGEPKLNPKLRRHRDFPPLERFTKYIASWVWARTAGEVAGLEWVSRRHHTQT